MIIARRGDSGTKVKIIQRILHLIQDGKFGINTEEAVRKFQTEHKITSDGIVGSKTWSLLLGNSLGHSKRKITEIIVHCSATKKGKHYDASDIRVWHKQQGWSDIGYHYVILLDGTVQRGRNVDIAGAHCAGHNANSIGVCYIGGIGIDGRTPEDTRTQQQKDAMQQLLLSLRIEYPQAQIWGHRDFAKKDCPSFDAHREYQYLM